MWEELVATYAQRARELSDGVAGLGKYRAISAEAIQAVADLKKLEASCKAASDQLHRYATLNRPAGSFSAEG